MMKKLEDEIKNTVFIKVFEESAKDIKGVSPMLKSKMNKIKFSHHYTKLQNYNDILPSPFRAELLQIFKCHYKDLSRIFITYDALYREEYLSSRYKLYKLPKTELIVLLFRAKYDENLFTTIRRYTPKKYEYYKSKMGEIFEVEIKED